MKAVKLQLANTRSELRPHGVVAAGCHTCHYRPDCHGIEPERGLHDCFDHHCGPGKCDKDGPCDNVCPYNPKYEGFIAEVNDLRFDDLPPLRHRRVSLPSYVPMIDHASSRSVPLDYPVVALNPYDLFYIERGRYKLKFETGDELRRHYLLDPDCEIILRGVDDDPSLERYWTYQRRDDAAGQLAKLGIQSMIGPNFSHFLDVVRTDNLYNRKRHLLCVAALASVGITAVPHLSGRQPGDWVFWKDYLIQNRDVKYVAVEFETGNRTPREAEGAVQRLETLQQQVGRSLHPMIVGGRQIIERVAGSFTRFTLIDSTPFFKSAFRQEIVLKGTSCKWESSPLLPTMPIDGLLDKNLTLYAKQVSDIHLRQRPARRQQRAG